MKNKDRRTHRKQPSEDAAPHGQAPVARWNLSSGGLQGVPFRSPVANVITVSSPLGQSRTA
jgi:hypothetical protein